MLLAGGTGTSRCAQLFHEFLVTVNDPVTSLILGGAYCSNAKEYQWQIRLRVSWDTPLRDQYSDYRGKGF